MKEITCKLIFLKFLKLGLYSFGGPTAHIGYLNETFVQKEKWVSEKEFMEMVTISQFLPGPTSSQISYCIGLKKKGNQGGVTAWLGFTLPSAILMVLAALFFTELTKLFGQASFIGLLKGFASVAIPIVLLALLKMYNMFCVNIQGLFISCSSALLMFSINWSMKQVLIIIVGFLLGILIKPGPKIDKANHNNGNKSTYSFLLPILILLFSVLILFFFPIFFLASEEIRKLSLLASFFKSGGLVFGGGHVVLPILELEFSKSGLINEEIFLAGYGLAQGLPGPLFSFGAYLGTVLGLLSGTTLSAIGFGLLCMLFINLPGLLLIPITINSWLNIKNITWIRDGLDGVNCAVIGFLLYILGDLIFINYLTNQISLVLVLLSCFLVIYLRFSSWLAVLIMGPLGLLLFSF